MLTGELKPTTDKKTLNHALKALRARALGFIQTKFEVARAKSITLLGLNFNFINSIG